jgi:hypothetical protein
MILYLEPQFIGRKVLNSINMRYFALILTGFFFCNSGASQTAEDSVKATITQLFKGMQNADSVMVENCFADSAMLQTIARRKDDRLFVRNQSVKEFAHLVGTLPRNAADERVSFKFIGIDGPLATAWTPYKFYFNEKFSHCGVNSFQLVRLNGQWKIQYLIDTRRKEGCE